METFGQRSRDMGEQYFGAESELEWEAFDDEVELKWLVDVEDGPDAHMVRLKPGSEIEPHSHTQNQWQIFLEGSGTFDGEELDPVAAHYTEANTVYGPIVAGDDGLVFLTLREKPAGYHPAEPNDGSH